MSFKRPTSTDIYERLRLEPPGRFLTAQLTAGIKDLHVRLRVRKQCEPTDFSIQTNDKGYFQPCQPVPLLGGRYQYLEIIGQGQSSVLIAARDTYQSEHKVVAIKVMHTVYKALGSQECDLMRQLRGLDPENLCRIVKLLTSFMFGEHYCMVLDYLRPRPLHKYFQAGRLQNEETKLKHIKKIAQQLVGVLGFLSRIGIIHADLKPENILCETGKKYKVKVIDFGNAIRCTYLELSLYYDDFELQTLLYRAPEVMFGVQFGTEIDMWSLGCILAELYLGEPLFIGRNTTEIMKQMVDLLGPFPCSPFKTGKFYQELSQFTDTNTLNPDCYIPEFKLMKRLNNSRNFQFANFLNQLLQYNPKKRITPSQAAQHPFLAGLMPVKFVMPETNTYGEKTPTDYPKILLNSKQYLKKPFISEDVLGQHLNSIELLRSGTHGSNIDAVVSVHVGERTSNTESTVVVRKEENTSLSYQAIKSEPRTITTTAENSILTKNDSKISSTEAFSNTSINGANECYKTEHFKDTCNDEVILCSFVENDKQLVNDKKTPFSTSVVQIPSSEIQTSRVFTGDQETKLSHNKQSSDDRKSCNGVGSNNEYFFQSKQTKSLEYTCSPTTEIKHVYTNNKSYERSVLPCANKRTSDVSNFRTPRKKKTKTEKNNLNECANQRHISSPQHCLSDEVIKSREKNSGTLERNRQPENDIEDTSDAEVLLLQY